ncbi:MAG: hypothetical protein HQ515_11985 [Phycisphaeraceae bacterium]|nr:hypothetical protein [Phycisphaeraceae bacterium]
MKARMHKTILLLLLGLSSSAMALSPIGPTQAVMGEKEWGVGLNVGFQTMDLVADGTYYEYAPGPTTRTASDKIAIKDVDSISSFVQINLGLSPKWDIYGLIGASNGDGDATVKAASVTATQGFNNGDKFDVNGDHEVSGGVGTRFTLADYDTIKWGGMAQITWHQPKGNSAWTVGGFRTTGTWELEYLELIVALGPTFVYENVEFYGGPFLHMVRGDMNFAGTTNDGTARTSQDLKEEAMVGGYAGMQMDLCENTVFYVDGQFTGKAWGVGVGTILRME